jgi:hypothetical protein
MRQLRSFLALLSILAVVAFCPLLMKAQSDYGNITGFVHDPTGASIPNAAVTVRNEATGTERKATTGQDGAYTVTNIPSGLYTVSVDAAGFKKYQSAHNKLDPTATLRVTVPLQIGEATQTVEVLGSTQALQTESAVVQKLVTRSQIDSIELNGRNPLYLAQLMPGVRRGSSLANFNFGLDSGGFNINGGRSQDNLITFDGAPAVRTRSNGTSIGVADVDSTQEIQVLTGDYAPEYRSASGGQIRIVTKSGGSQFHGSLFEYVRNSAFNANTWKRNQSASTNFASPFRYNQFGYNIGGPFFIPGHFNKDRNKIFFFWGQEWLRYRFTDTQTQTVPTDLMRNGNFSELATPGNPFYKGGATVYDPATCPSVGAATCAPFAGNIIPQDRLSPNGIGLLRAYPAPNTPFISGNQNWIAAAAHPINQRKDTLTADFYPTENHHVAFHRQNYAYFEFQPFDGGSDRVPKFFLRPNQTNSLNYTWTISPTMVNEAMASVSLDDVYIPLNLSNGLYDRTKYGINYPYIFPVGKEVQNRIPTLSIPNFYGLNGGPYPSHSSGPIYDVSDNLTKVSGKHTFKFGVLYERSGENDGDEINVNGVPGGTNNQNGRFQFSDSRTGGGATSGVGVANAALGLFDTYAEIGQRAYTPFRGSMWEMYAQDSWKVTNHVTLEYGARYTINIPFSAMWRNMDTFDPAFYNPANAVKLDPKTGYIIPGSGDQYNGVVIPGNGFPDSAKGRVPAADSGEFDRLFRGLPSYYSKIHYDQIQPRLGVAWALDDKTVLRAGGGRYYSRLGVSDSIFLGGNSPFQPIASVSNGIVDNPGGAAQNLFPLTLTNQDRIYKNPESFLWNATVERQTIWDTVLTVGYVGRRGLHGQRERDVNQLQMGTLQAPANKGINTDYLRPYKGFAVLRTTNNDANSMYNGFQVNLSKRFAHGVGFGIAYTLSASNDDGSNQRDIIPNAYDAHNLWAPSEFDTRHVLVINYIWDIPIFRDRSKLSGKLLGGWQLSGVTQFQTGTPCGVGSNDDFAGVGSLGSFGCGSQGQFWVVNGNPTIQHNFASSSKDPAQWFATTNPDGTPIFTKPAAGTFNQQSVRNLIYGPGLSNWNLSLFKKFLITEQTGFEFRADAFNFVNHPNWNGPDYNPTSNTFGKVTGKSDSSRQLQLSLRFMF